MASENETVRRVDVSTRGDALSYPAKISWGAVFAGAVAALGVWMMLYALGLALGLSSVNPNDPSTLKSSGAFTGVWSLIAPLVALFVGGLVAGREAGMVTKLGGAIHGVVVWGLTSLAAGVIVVNLAAALIGSAAAMGKTAVQAGAGAAMGMSQGNQNGEPMGRGMGFGLDIDNVIKPINQRLHADGKPTITSEQMRAATNDVMQQAWQKGSIDRSMLVNSIAQNTALTRADAEQIATRLETQFNSAKENIGERISSAADTTGKVFWAVFGAMLLGLAASIVGAAVGVSKSQRIWAARAVPPPRDLAPMST